MDEYDEIKLVYAALQTFAEDDTKWDSNCSMFCWLYEDKQRIIWWRRAKKQAEAGVPAMQQLLLKVIELRLKG